MSILTPAVLCLVLFMPQVVLAQTKPAPHKSAQTAAPKPPPADPSPASGQAEGSNPAQIPNKDQISTTIYGDWILRCQRPNGLNEGSHSNCEASLTIQQKNQNAPIAKIAIAWPPGSKTAHLLILLPANISFPSSVQIRSDSQDTYALDIPWQRCIPSACMAETSLTDADMIRWHGLDTSGRITFKDAQFNEIGIEFSFRGLGQALDAMTQQSQ